MATTILLKKSATTGSTPLSGDLELGELAVNYADRKIFAKDGSGNVFNLAGAQVGTAYTGTAAEGDLWYDTTNNILKTYNGSSFVAAGYTTLGQFGITATAAEINKLDGVTATTTELNHVDGVTSNIQTQLDGKAASSHTHTLSDITDVTATAAELNKLDGVTATTTELNHVDGVTSNIQTQLNNKASTSHNHTLDSLSNTTITSNTSGEILKWNGTAWVNNTLSEAGIQAAGDYALTNHNHDLSTLDDVTVTSIGSGEVLMWNGSAWINRTMAELEILPTELVGVNATAAEINVLDGITATTTELNHTDGVTSNIQTQLNNLSSTINGKPDDLGDLGDVNIASVADNELLAYDGSSGNWINQTAAEAGFATVATSGSYNDLSNTPTIPTVNDANIDIIAGTGLSGGGLFTTNDADNTDITLDVDLNEVTTATSADSSDLFAFVDVTDNGTKKIAQSNIQLSKFDNDAAFISEYTETDTLASVTGRGNSTNSAIDINNSTQSTSTTTGALTVVGGIGAEGNLNVGGNAIITGDLTVNGTTTTVNSNTVNIGDNIIVLNADETGTPSQDGGIEVERGTSANVSFKWIESSDYWSLGGEELADVTIDGGSY